MPSPPEFLGVYHNSHFCSFPVSFYPATLLLHVIPSCSAYSVTLLALCLFLFHSCLLIALCRFQFAATFSRFPMCHRGQQTANRVTSCHRNEEKLPLLSHPPASSAKPLPPKRQQDKGKRFFEGLLSYTFPLRHMAVQLLYMLVDSVCFPSCSGLFLFCLLYLRGSHFATQGGKLSGPKETESRRITTPHSSTPGDAPQQL